MIKNFVSWHKLKSSLDERTQFPTYQRRDIWWCSIGTNIGHEVDGKNEFFNLPVLVLRKFNKHIFLGIPLTTQIKENPYYIKITIHGREQCAMISQIRTYESKRLTKQLGKLDDVDFNKVREAIKNMI